MFRFALVAVVLLGLSACNSQHVGHGLQGATQPVYVPPPVSYQPVTVITPSGTVFCNRIGNLITCY